MCSPSNCLNRTSTCPSDKCVRKPAECLKPPCPKWAECTTSETSKQVDIPKDQCFPNTTQLSRDCAKIHVVFSVRDLPEVSQSTNEMYCRQKTGSAVTLLDNNLFASPRILLGKRDDKTLVRANFFGMLFQSWYRTFEKQLCRIPNLTTPPLQGTLVEEFCYQLSYLPLLKSYAVKGQIRLYCDGVWGGKGSDSSETATVIISVVRTGLPSPFHSWSVT